MNMKAFSLSCAALFGALAVIPSAFAQPVRVFSHPGRGEANPPLWRNDGRSGRPESTTGSAPPYTPAQVRQAYGFDQLKVDGTGQTIAIVDAYDDSQYIASDLAAFDSKFGLSAPPSFKVIYASGSKPAANSGWQQEISLDVEWAHAIAPGANILLVEAANNSTASLLQAVQVAVNNGANVVSMSWGGGESSGEISQDSYFTASGVTFVASAGDSAEGVEWPAGSPNVLSVGGTSLTVSSSGAYASEVAWASSGGGISAYEGLPAWQAGWSSYLAAASARGVPDVSYLADPNTGVYVVYVGQLYEFGGTSVGAPQWAALIALANQGRGSNLIGANQAIYSLANGGQAGGFYTVNSSFFHDINSGNDGSDPDDQALAGYDLVTGVGTPVASALVPALAAWTPKPDFALSIAPSSITIPPSGGTTNYTVTLSPLNGFNGSVTLSQVSLPANMVASLSSSALGGVNPLTATLTVTVGSGASIGTNTFTVTGTSVSPTLSHTASANLVIATIPTMTVSQIAYSTSGRKSANLIVTVTVVNNLGNPVSGAAVSISLKNTSLSQSWAGSGTTGSNGQVGFTLSNAPSGTYTTVVNSVAATGFTWDGKYPSNSFKK